MVAVFPSVPAVRYGLCAALLLSLLPSAGAVAATADQPLLNWSVLNRNYLISSAYRGADQGRPYRREWAHGLLADVQSGYTPGVLGLGADVHGFAGYRLDSQRGHAGTGLLAADSDGGSVDSYGSSGGAVKLRMRQTVVKYGEMSVATPVFATADKRLQPEYATGFWLQSDDLPRLSLQAGHFTAFKNQDASTAHGEFSGYGATTAGSAISLAGARWKISDTLRTAVFVSQLDDTWRQSYLNLNWQQQGLSLDGNLYRSRDQGRRRAGAIDTLAYSVAARYQRAAHGIMLAYQKINGDTPFDFVGGDSIALANSIKYADFNGAHERSLQARYDFDFAALGIPGLSLMARYVKGWGIDGTHAEAGGAYNPFDSTSGDYQPQQGQGGKHWERDLQVRYQVPAGPFKDLSLSLAEVGHRGNAAQGGANIERLYLLLQYPLQGSL
ncbi:OprD family outer membrane porin [Pokkaliibacter sp. MBI-7]|uniref:OprD family outer membrane porin n=1 Tax=Pokkaliibacter sp. MBI-7 TaxID=3040600 RepID=UPI00244C2080|nr:OprD family outer membrane porin [Pokkaliibacter sp. MBI-7]MDH2434078.1 OprD family outer membrane porin [Pokkaliibacter sp. MBI-7]